MLSLTDGQLIAYLIQFIGFILALLIALLAWLGVKVLNRLDKMADTLAAIEKDLRKDFSALDRRVHVLELSTFKNPRYYNPNRDNIKNDNRIDR